MLEKIGKRQIIPVVTIDNANNAEPLADDFGIPYDGHTFSSVIRKSCSRFAVLCYNQSEL